MLSDGWIGPLPPCVQPHWIRGGVLYALVARISPTTFSLGLDGAPSLPLLSLRHHRPSCSTVAVRRLLSSLCVIWTELDQSGLLVASAQCHPTK